MQYLLKIFLKRLKKFLIQIISQKVNYHTTGNTYLLIESFFIIKTKSVRWFSTIDFFIVDDLEWDYI